GGRRVGAGQKQNDFSNLQDEPLSHGSTPSVDGILSQHRFPDPVRLRLLSPPLILPPPPSPRQGRFLCRPRREHASPPRSVGAGGGGGGLRASTLTPPVRPPPLVRGPSAPPPHDPPHPPPPPPPPPRPAANNTPPPLTASAPVFPPRQKRPREVQRGDHLPVITPTPAGPHRHPDPAGRRHSATVPGHRGAG